MRIAIIGTGGVGGYLGAKLWSAGNDVVFVARGVHLAAMQSNGMKLLSPEGDLHILATFTGQLTGLPAFDLIIVAVKSFDTPAVAEMIRPVFTAQTSILSIQNGVENEDLLAQSLHTTNVIGGVAYILSTIHSPGVIQHTGGTGKFKIGEMDGNRSDNICRINDVFRLAGINSEINERIAHVMWDKWIFICGIGGMTAYTQSTIGEILSHPDKTAILHAVVHEAAEIARAKGISSFDGIEEKQFAHYNRLPAGSTSSMYYDRMHGKRLEVEVLNGAVVRFGKSLGISTPANEKIYNELKPLS